MRIYLGDELILHPTLNSRFGLIWINFGSNQEPKGSFRKIIESIIKKLITLSDELILHPALNSRFGLIWINFGSNQESKGSIRKIIEFIMRWAVDAWMDVRADRWTGG